MQPPDKKAMTGAGQAEQPQPQSPEQGQENPNQDLYTIFVAQGIKLASTAAKTLQGKASVDGIGNALFEIVNKIETEGAKNGIRFGLDVVLHGSNEILGHLIQRSGVQIDENQIKAAIGIATGKWIENAVKTGKMTAEEIGQLAEQAKASMPQQQDQGGGGASPGGVRPPAGMDPNSTGMMGRAV